MSKTLETITTSGGAKWHKKVDSAGREYVHKEGDGIQGYMSGNGRQKWAAAASHTGESEIIQRGNRGGIDAIEDVSELGGEYTATLTRNVEQYEPGSAGRKEAADVNRWLGFKHSNDTPDDPVEAAKQYSEMKQRLKDATTPEEELDIKRDYNIGGS